MQKKEGVCELLRALYAQDQKLEFKLPTKDQCLKIEQALTEGIPFFHEWMKRYLSVDQQANTLAEIECLPTFVYQKSKYPLQFPKFLIETLYQAAKSTLIEGQSAAVHLFYLLSHLAPHTFDVWLGLGLACQKINEHKEALIAFEEAKSRHPNIFYAYLYAAESYLKIEDLEACQKSGIKALKLMTQEDQKFHQYATHLLKVCEQKKESSCL